MKATVIATMILASLLLLAVPAAAELGAEDMVQSDTEPLEVVDPAAIDYGTLCCEKPQYCGLTLGYWKNHLDAWPIGYSPDQKVGSVFGASTYAETTLLDALGFGGGNGLDGAERILLKQAVAAILNEATFGDCYQACSTCWITGETNAAIQSSDRATMIALAEQLDRWNNAGESS